VSMERRSGARSRAREGVRRRDTADRVDKRCATVREDGDDEKSGVGGDSKSYESGGTSISERYFAPTDSEGEYFFDEINDEYSDFSFSIETLRRS
jgi:hypothetical protein